MNEVEETLRVIDAQIGYHKNQIKELNAAKKEVLDKYNIQIHYKEVKDIYERDVTCFIFHYGFYYWLYL